MRSTTLPVHATLLDPVTRLPLRALGVVRGRPVWPILGGSGDGDGDGDSGDGGGKGGDTGKGGDGKEFKPPATQADLDRIISDRLARERQRFSDYESLKAKAEKYDEAEKAKASDIDKARQEGREEATTAGNKRVVNAEAKAVAARLKFHNPADVIGLVDFSTVKIDKDGEPDTARIQELIEDAVKARPYLVADSKGDGKGQRSDRSQGARPGEKTTGREAGLAEAQKRFGKKS